MTEIDDFFLSINVDDPPELITAISNDDASLDRMMYDYLGDISDNQLFSPLVWNSNSNNLNDADEDTTDPTISNHQQLIKLGPIRSTLPTNGIPVPNQQQVKDQQSNQLDSTKSEIPRKWHSRKSYIEVSLLTIDNQPHPYTIKNKESDKSSLVVKQNESNTIYYDVTNDDLVKGYKSYKIEFVKCKQDGKIITKEKIKQRQLNESKLRFTRFYRTDNGSYVPDTTTIIYSDQMKEDYGKFSVKDIFPLYGPLRSHQKVCIETKGPPSEDFKNNFLINIIINDMNWSYQIEEFNKNGNIVTFYMPVPPNLPMNHVEATINIGYEQNVIYQANYLYISGLDEVLASKTSNESDERAAVNFSSSNSSSTSSSMEMNSGNRSRKRTRI
ncbi:unnamed protein product [Adineta steineri]|uniref:Uncharacterized protein n=1 Tax=Adineta steineri TaxID=433720 RepID=A0A814NKF5_9BILA|nr:unnamed protein product [Adineta steineri]CAF3486752.1 unnamed protein product [Adineta steineri]